MHRRSEHRWQGSGGGGHKDDDDDEQMDAIMLRLMPEETENAKRLMAPMWHKVAMVTPDRHG